MMMRDNQKTALAIESTASSPLLSPCAAASSPLPSPLPTPSLSASLPSLEVDQLSSRARRRSGGYPREHPRRSDHSPPAVHPPRLRLSRDPLQPASGSLAELRRPTPPPGAERLCGGDEAGEEADEFPSFIRPRASTCPETKAFKRKLRVRMNNRPPTPPPLLGGAAPPPLWGVGEEWRSSTGEGVRVLVEDWSTGRRPSDVSCCLAPDLSSIDEAT